MKKTKKQKIDLTFDSFDSFLSEFNNSRMDNAITAKSIRRLSAEELDFYYAKDSIIAKICDKPTQDMVRQGIDINDDRAEDLNVLWEKFSITSKLKELLIYDAIYGGSALIFDVNDGLENTSLELDYTKISELKDILVVDRFFLNPIDYNGFKDPVMYMLMNFGSNYLNIHESRMCLLKGINSGLRNKQTLNSFGESKVFRVLQAINNYNGSHDLLPEILLQYITNIFKFEGMTEKIMNGQEAVVKKKAKAVQISKNLLGALVMDSKDEYVSRTLNVSGLRDIIEMIERYLCAKADMPHTHLLQEGTNKGLSNNGNDSQETKQWYDFIKFEQEVKLKPIINKILKVFQAILGMDLSKDVKYSFNSLQQKTDLEKAQIKETISKSDKNYYDMGFNPEIIFNNRFNQGDYSQEIDLSSNTLPILKTSLETTQTNNAN